MWRTQLGNRILTGAEADLFREGLGSLWFYLDQGEDVEMPVKVGAKLFDQLLYEQKLAMLEVVGRALLRKHIRAPELTAVAEASVAAVFYHIQNELEVEIDEGRLDLRRLILAACKQMGKDDELPKLRSTKLDAWRWAVDGMMECIFWDADWEEELVPLDMEPSAAQSVKDFGGILDDYYTSLAPDPTPAQLKRIRANLRRLVGLEPPASRRRILCGHECRLHQCAGRAPDVPCASRLRIGTNAPEQLRIEFAHLQHGH